ncbi:MAG: hypothetical protein MUE51_11570 [Thermoleophilia bacterium]|jgi:hypothetical protein|nr:hypothetical protein [Thermoleophilia bacterium]
MRRAAAALSALAGLALPAGAAAIPFGANLDRPANSRVDCTLLPFGFFASPTNVTTCTWTAIGRLGDFSEGLNVPAGRGTITAVRVRVGPVTGPMQAVVFRSLRNPLSTTPPVCCQVVGLSPVFTPAPNAVTTVQVAFPVVNDRVVEPGLEALRFDTLALSVLAPGVPIPAHDTGNYDPSTAQGGLGFYPALTRIGEERVGPAGLGGYQLLVSGEWVPAPEGTQGVDPALGGPGGVSPAAVRLVQPAVSVAGPVATLGLTCGPAAPCVGLVRLQSAPGARQGAQVAGARVVTYATGRFRIAPGATGRVRSRLSSAGRSLVRRTPRARVWANVTMGGRLVSSTRVRLR